MKMNCNNTQLVLSPLVCCQVVPGLVSPLHCQADGPGPREASVGSPQEFSISLRDAWGNLCPWGEADVGMQAFWLAPEGPGAIGAANLEPDGPIDVTMGEAFKGVVVAGLHTLKVSGQNGLNLGCRRSGCACLPAHVHAGAEFVIMCPSMTAHAAGAKSACHSEAVVLLCCKLGSSTAERQ